MLRDTRVRYHSDNRRRFYGDIFGTVDGDVNVVYLQKNVPIFWHRHQKQDDHLWLISGCLLVRSFLTTWKEDGVEHVMVAMPGARRVITIPHGEWHGYESLDDGTVILQFNGPGKWDGYDEERMDRVPWNPA